MRAETVYVVVIALLSTVCGFLFAQGRELALMDIVLVKLVSTSVFLVFTFSLLFSLRGTKYDVLKEIFDEDKGGAAIFTGLLLVAMALVVAK